MPTFPSYPDVNATYTDSLTGVTYKYDGSTWLVQYTVDPVLVTPTPILTDVPVGPVTGTPSHTTVLLGDGTWGTYTTGGGTLDLSSTLTGFSSMTGTVTASDSILTALEKLNGNVNQVVFSASISYTHTQVSAQNTWTIAHNLNKYPSVTVIDSFMNTVIGEIVYNNSNTLTITFTASFSGTAYLT